MSTLCSILVPSRRRFDRLLKTLASLRYSADKPDDFEFLVRFDENDSQATGRFMELAYHPGFQAFWGFRPDRWDDGIKILWNELAEHATGEWIWAMSDDMTIEKNATSLSGDMTGGNGWDTQLAAMPKHCYVQPDCHKLGGSTYDRDVGGPVPVIRREFWWVNDQFSLIDTTICEVAKKNGLALRWLDGIRVNHLRDYENILAEHRKH